MSTRLFPKLLIEQLVERRPTCFAVYEKRRQPLKLGIHHDILAALGAVGKRNGG